MENKLYYPKEEEGETQDEYIKRFLHVNEYILDKYKGRDDVKFIRDDIIFPAIVKCLAADAEARKWCLDYINSGNKAEEAETEKEQQEEQNNMSDK